MDHYAIAYKHSVQTYFVSAVSLHEIRPPVARLQNRISELFSPPSSQLAPAPVPGGGGARFKSEVARIRNVANVCDEITLGAHTLLVTCTKVQASHMTCDMIRMTEHSIPIFREITLDWDYLGIRERFL